MVITLTCTGLTNFMGPLNCMCSGQFLADRVGCSHWDIYSRLASTLGDPPFGKRPSTNSIVRLAPHSVHSLHRLTALRARPLGLLVDLPSEAIVAKAVAARAGFIGNKDWILPANAAGTSRRRGRYSCICKPIIACRAGAHIGYCSMMHVCAAATCLLPRYQRTVCCD